MKNNKYKVLPYGRTMPEFQMLRVRPDGEGGYDTKMWTPDDESRKGHKYERYTVRQNNGCLTVNRDFFNEVTGDMGKKKTFSVIAVIGDEAIVQCGDKMVYFISTPWRTLQNTGTIFVRYIYLADRGSCENLVKIGRKQFKK